MNRYARDLAMLRRLEDKWLEPDEEFEEDEDGENEEDEDE